MGTLPATGSAIKMGVTYKAYTNVTPTAGTNVKLSNTLGATYGGKVSGAVIAFSSTFGGKTTPYAYP